MKSLFAVLSFAILMVAVPLTAQATDPSKWTPCQLGKASIAPGPAPQGAVVFKTTGGPVVMSERGSGNSVTWVTCNLPKDTEVYRGMDGTLRDLPSNQPFYPINWEANPPEWLVKAAQHSTAGATGPQGPVGPQGPQGPAGRDGHDASQGVASAQLPAYCQTVLATTLAASKRKHNFEFSCGGAVVKVQELKPRGPGWWEVFFGGSSIGYYNGGFVGGNGGGCGGYYTQGMYVASPCGEGGVGYSNTGGGYNYHWTTP